MDGKIAVAGMKPDGLSQLSHSLKAEEGIALHAPATLLAQQAGQNIGDGIDVGGNVKPPPFEVVAGVDDESEFVGRDDLAQTINKFGAAGSSGEDHDHAAHLRAYPCSSAASARRFASKAGRELNRDKNSG